MNAFFDGLMIAELFPVHSHMTPVFNSILLKDGCKMDYQKLIGEKTTREQTVTRELLASWLKSGTVDVFATPAMIALMEYTASSLVQPFLDEGITTVGTAVNVTHINPTPEGAVVRAEAEIIETDGRRFLFKVTAWDQAGLIGEGTHERYTVKRDRLQENASARLV
jgi:predicted thioesterase